MRIFCSLSLLFVILCGCGMKVEKTNPAPDMVSTKAATGRFIDKGDGTIADTRSGLIWLKKANISEELLTWQEAIDFCKNLTAAGHNDWRLPTKDEIVSLTAGLPVNSDWRPYLEKQGFMNVQDFYWSSTQYAPDASNAWSAPMALGYIGIYDKVHKGCVWPVRTGP